MQVKSVFSTNWPSKRNLLPKHIQAAGDCVGGVLGVAGVIVAWFWPR